MVGLSIALWLLSGLAGWWYSVRYVNKTLDALDIIVLPAIFIAGPFLLMFVLIGELAKLGVLKRWE